jgi:hypothetical protein
VFSLPHEQLVTVLVDARRRGLSSDEAWREALGKPSQPDVGVRLPHQTSKRREWLEVFAATREEWRRAYCGEPSSVSEALVVLTGLLAEDRSSSAARPERGDLDPVRVARAPFALALPARSARGRGSEWPETRDLAA